MFSLIVSLISLLLVTVVTMAGVYYGGAAYKDAGDRARAVQLSNDAEQMRTAIQMFHLNEGRLPETPEELVDKRYLTQVPPNWSGNQQYFSNTSDLTEDVCLAFNTKRGIPFVPECADEAYRNLIVCCRNFEAPA